MNKKERLIFMHIPKCGGSTFYKILERIYPSRHVIKARVDDENPLDGKQISKQAAQKNTQLLLFQGHIQFGLHSQLRNHYKYLTFLRDPLERVLSYYFYLKRSPGSRLRKNGLFRNDMSLYDFVVEIDQPDIHNGQISFISGIQSDPKEMLEVALKNIEEHFAFAGTVENFNESLMILQNKLGWASPYYFVKNKTGNRPKIEKIDSEVIKAITERNKEDMELYSFVQSKLNEQFIELDLSHSLKKFERLNQFYRYPIRWLDLAKSSFI